MSFLVFAEEVEDAQGSNEDEQRQRGDSQDSLLEEEGEVKAASTALGMRTKIIVEESTFKVGRLDVGRIDQSHVGKHGVVVL